ncbi:FAD-dependent oxidoreductase [Ralstonia pseudosolanacearum]|uniref:FAD-dependent oxidoreductase n=1 Tax=Ralstonia pseudosolanacearum TaxID=1310165 RepID=UPI0006BCE2F6|nr:FAD-binding oxidoreductase [Ralstonia pseudosolanacearum]AKZ24954.1 isoquinoline biosynthesis protein [Ralstonia solanacearum]BCL93760.1 oxidoreductase [Ralstonia solanacearum]BCL98874.1 oxidoreductase [Ralstonia solanacearum]BCM14316.1 oxidoreductase [Ralstonia solanacearum]BCN06326.1 oxidoreductase [Ralstonia solanacearum]
MTLDVTRQDPRYDTLRHGFNLRWPSSDAQAAGRIALCEKTDEVAPALQRIIDTGMRPTVRSGGHCYEDFVSNNPGGVIVDLSLLNAPEVRADGAVRVPAGMQNWNGALELYKRHGVTLPGGSCYSVGAGGHISGGGYGLLSRLQGLTVDWLSAVDIVTVDKQGRAAPRTVNAARDPDLFRACSGAGGGNFGIITSYTFARLPEAPREVALATVAFDWAAMTPERFAELLRLYGDYWATRGKDPDTWGLFSLLKLTHKSAGQIVMLTQFCNPDGTCRDLSVLNDFLARFQVCAPVPARARPPGYGPAHRQGVGQLLCSKPHTVVQYDWLTATQSLNGSGPNQRGKYKSAYMKRGFTAREAQRIYTHLTRTVQGIDLSQSLLQVDSYGGAVNKAERIADTAVPQRASVMKLQYQTYWTSAADDAGHLRWIGDFYRDVYGTPDVSAPHAGTPYPGDRYEGCYINYPDVDMLAYPFWPQLYYGDGDLYAFLQRVKRRYDPNNIFHHAMSVRP